MDEVKAKLDSVHKLLRKQVSFVEDVEAVERRADEEEVNYIGGTRFQGSGNQGGNRNSYGNRMVKEGKLQEGDFEVESLMSFGGSQWCRSTPDLEYQSTYTSPYRSIGTPEHRSTTPTETTASCNAMKILTHEEFAAKHTHPPNPDKVRITRRADTSIDRQGESSIDRHKEAAIDRQPPAQYPPEAVRTPSDDGEDPMEEDRVPTGRTLRRRKEKVAKHLKRRANVKTPQTISRRINDPGIIAACHCGEDYETDYSASIETHTATSIDSGHQKSTAIPHVKSVDSRQDDWKNDYYNLIMAVNDALAENPDDLYDEERFNMQIRDETRQGDTTWGRTRTCHPIDRAIHPSIDTHHQQSTDNDNATSIDNRSIPKTTVSEKDKLDDKYLILDEFGIFRDPDGYAKAINSRTLHVSREDIADILQIVNGGGNLFMHHRNNPEQKATKEFYDTAGGIDNNFIQKSRHPTQTSIDVAIPTLVDRQPEFGKRAYDLYGNMKFSWEEKDEYGVYRDDQRYARDLDGNPIRLHNTYIRRVLEKASRDELSYICLPKHANLFTQTKLVPEIYTKDEINEMFYGVCGEHEKNKEAFQMKLDGVYHLLNDSISWLTTCMEEMKQDIARI
ncbi:hypothetical protein DY000_02014407 [Brassica cretica]|uniref:Uncharacterized protein n=1 Tax=Brassica cretica TaxID=69181 RepID=A0ABQ7D7T3_BRACR|nr:hypothetical protein DY000_02014407 [Brassica cretica]